MQTTLLTNNHNKYIKGIDGLRALAVLSVMLFHLEPSYLPGGFTGVDVFFVISGYVVSRSLAREYHPNFVSFVTNFYARRIVRIFPALIACLLITCVLTTLFVPSSWLSNTNEKTALGAFFGVSNFILVQFNDGYFSPKLEFNPFTHTWSLGIEEQFYLIFPLIFFCWLKSKNKARVIRIMANWLLPIMIIMSLLYAWHETKVNPDGAFYLLPSRFWELACGVLLFTLHTRKKLIFTSTAIVKACLITGLALIILGFIFADQKAFPFPWALLPVSGTLLLIIATVNHYADKSIIQKFFENVVLVYIGKLSYSLYLWHWPVYVLFRWTVGLESVLNMSIAITLVFLLAMGSFHYIETCFRKSKLIAIQPNWQIVFIGCFVITMAFLFSLMMFNSKATISLSVTNQQKVWYPYRWPNKSKEYLNKREFFDRKLFVVGDSHAGAYSTMLQKLSDEHGIKIIKYSKGGCGVTNLIYPVLTNKKCAKMIESQVVNIKKQASPGDILFLASLRMNRLGNQWEAFSETNIFAKQSSEKAAYNRELALQETIEFIKDLEKLQLKIIIDAPKPVFKSPPFRCADWFNDSNPVCSAGFNLSRDYLLRHRQPIMEALKILTKRFPKLIIWDPLPILCGANTCSAFDHEKPLFFDGDHLSAHGNRVLYPSFQALIKNIWDKS